MPECELLSVEEQLQASNKELYKALAEYKKVQKQTEITHRICLPIISVCIVIMIICGITRTVVMVINILK